MTRSILKFALATAAMLYAVPAHADCMAEISSVMAGARTVGPYHQATTMISASRTMNIEGNVILPDQFDINMPQGRMIMTKNGAWMQKGGKWTKMPDTMRKMLGANVAQGAASSLKNIINTKCLGAQDFEGNSHTTYEFDTSGVAMGIKSKSHVTLYVDDGKPVVMVIDGEAMGRKSHTVQKITYDASIKITEPK